MSVGSTLPLPAASAQDARYPSSQHPVASSADAGWRGNPGYRAVPQVRSAELTSRSAEAPAGSDESRRPGWNLQWRTSPEVAAQQARQISEAAFVQRPAPAAWTTPTPTSKTIATAASSIRQEGEVAVQAVAVEPNRLRQGASGDIQPVAWMAPQTESRDHGFSLPGNTFRDGTAPPPARTEMVPPGPSFDDADELPSPVQPPANLPPSAPEPPRPSTEGLQDLFDEGVLGAPPAGDQPPTTSPSIRGMLQEELPAPRPNENQSRDQSPLRPLDPPDSSGDIEESPSDREMFAPNPFGNRNRDAAPAQEERSSRDRARLRRDAAPSIFGPDDEGPTNSGTGLSCEDFRERIRVATIDQVSLDPSPPFRPDVIDDEEFEKLKDKFSEKQQARTWRNIDGRTLGTGRLEDLAYEKAVIVTDFGSREELPLNQLSEADLAYISQNWGLPTECLIEQVAFTPRNWTSTTMTYTASNLCHKPLYFEEVNLERYGHTAGPLAQPVISSAHFFLNIAVLPYKMGVHMPHECQYALGYYRPGNCAPWIIPPVPLSVRGAWYQAAAMTGTALLIP